MSQYDDFIARNAGYDDERIAPVEEPIDEPGFATILDLEGEAEEWSRINETLQPHIDEFDVTPPEQESN